MGRPNRQSRKTNRPDRDPIAGPCVPAADLTAFAHGELPDWHRAEISKHLLRCPACREESSGAASMFARLAALGAEGDAWRGEVRAAETVIAASRRVSTRAVFAGAAAAAVVVAGLALWTAGRGVDRIDRVDRIEADGDARVVASTDPAGGSFSVARAAPGAPLSVDESALLAAQAADGRWSGGASRDDEATTGLALLALAARRPADLRDGAVGRATAAATSWLLARQQSDGRFGHMGRSGSALSVRDQAVATAALLEVYAVTREDSLRAPVDRAVKVLARRAREAAPRDDSGARWTRLALVRARDLGWDRLDGAIERAGGSSPWRADARADGWLAAVGGMSDERPTGDRAAGSPAERAIRVLRGADRG